MSHVSRRRHVSEPAGPYRVSDVAVGERLELSHGHPVYCAPTGGRGADSSADAPLVLRTDPDVVASGTDVGYRLSETTLRAPDFAVGNVPRDAGWVDGAPKLALEYADTGQDEVQLKAKIAQLLAAGTQHVWVVRLNGPKHVEDHRPGRAMRKLSMKDTLEAPGILRNPVPVAALFNPDEARRVALRNLVQREGYESFEAALAESKAEGKIEGKIEFLLTLLSKRHIRLSASQRRRIESCTDEATIDRWAEAAIDGKSARAILAK